MRISLLAVAIILSLASCTKKPVANFEATESDENPLIYQFTNTSEAGEKYLWNFGDGKTSRTANPTHHYREAGTYTIVLTTENGKQFNSIAKTIEVEKAIWEINQMTAQFSKPEFEFVSDSTIYRQDAAHTFITGYQKISNGLALVDIHLPLNVGVGEYRIQDDEVVVNRWHGTVATNYNRKTATGVVYINRIFNDTMWGSFNVMHGSWNYGSTYGEFKVAVE